MFQSTPAPIGAGDIVTLAQRLHVPGFNPHPPRSERVTGPMDHPHSPAARFNPHPPRSERVTSDAVLCGTLRSVSIHTRPDRSG